MKEADWQHDLARTRQKRKKLPVLPSQRTSMSSGSGKARAVKDRLTLLARQGLEGLFGQGPEPSLQNLKGKILDSVLIVHCQQRCRLELISESGTWTKTHSFWENGQHRVRQEGEKVKPVSLMKSWRELRRCHPALLQKRSEGLGPAHCLHG